MPWTWGSAQGHLQTTCFFSRNLHVGSDSHSCHVGVMENTFACPCQGHFWNQVFLEYLDPQALVLTHEGASKVEQLPYLGVMLSPTPVLDFYGRCATRDPPCHKNHAVFYWWQDPQTSHNYTKKQKHLGPFCWMHGFHLSSGCRAPLHDRWPARA